MKLAELKPDFDNYKMLLNVKGLPERGRQGRSRALHVIGDDLIKSAKKLIIDKTKKTGRVYIIRTKTGRLKKHRASAPGEAPASMTGQLCRSLGYEGANTGNRLEFGAGGRGHKLRKGQKLVEYAKFLEKGTKRMAKRPFLKPAIKSNFRNIENHIAKCVDEAIKQGWTK